MGRPPEVTATAGQRGGDRHRRAAAAGRRRGRHGRTHPAGDLGADRGAAARAPGDGVVGADEDAAAGGPIARAGRPLRAHDLGMLAAAGITALAVHARPRVAIVSTGDELVPPIRRPSSPARSATPSGRPSLRSFARPAASPSSPASCRTTARRWPPAALAASRDCDCWWCRRDPRWARATRPPPRSPRSASRDLVPRPLGQARQADAPGRLPARCP